MDLIVNDTKSGSLMEWYSKKSPEEQNRIKKLLYGHSNGRIGLIHVLCMTIKDLFACSKEKPQFSEGILKILGQELIARYSFIARLHSGNSQNKPIFLTDNIKAVTGSYFTKPSKRLRANERDDILAAMVADIGVESLANMTQREIKNRALLKYNVIISERSISQSSVIHDLLVERSKRKEILDRKSQPSKFKKMSDS